MAAHSFLKTEVRGLVNTWGFEAIIDALAEIAQDEAAKLKGSEASALHQLKLRLAQTSAVAFELNL